ncbi:U11/U12 small nuclear ribonucleoprotein 35 kDa protein [Cunninghamella echinulata]|nr:U11/U12 small nuclear ribonucleoprotein 35 kDa protein [Cunninghamella echinulata]
MSYAKVYNPLQAGTINGNPNQDIPHDHAIARAQRAKFHPPSKHVITTNPLKTLFVGRLNFNTTEETLTDFFERYGKITKAVIIRNFVTGLSEGYGFITFERSYACQEAYKRANQRILDDHRILVDYELGRTMKGWIPRRLGGGFSGKKESGQLRFGGRDKPFQSG